MAPKKVPKNTAKTNGRQSSRSEALRRKEDRVQAMIEIGRSLTAIPNLDEFLRTVVGWTTRLMESDRSSLFLVDTRSQEVWSKIAEGDGLKEIRLPLGQGVIGWVAQTGEPVKLNDAYADPRFQPLVDRATGYTTRNLLARPLRGKSGNVLGVIETLNKHGGEFGEDDERLLDALASQIGIALENTQLLERERERTRALEEVQSALQRKIHELDVLFQLEREISTATDLDQMLAALLQKATRLFGCEAGSILLSSDTAEQLLFVAAVGERAERVKRLSLPLGAGVAGWVAQHGEPALVNCPGKDPRHLDSLEQQLDFPVRNILALPLSHRGERLGAIEFLNKCCGEFQPDDIKILTLMASQAAAAIQVGRSRDECTRAARLSSIGQALSGVIHDFRTPMTVVSGYVQLMALEPVEATRTEQAETVLRQLDFIGDMTREILAFARGESQLLLHKVYTNRLLKDMEEVLRRELELSSVQLEVEDSYGGPLRADENKLRRMIYNLTRNARQAMPSGGRFFIRVRDCGTEACFEFADTGPGIPEDIRHKLFQSFVTHGKKDGTGLGLAVVKKIVDEHQGRIEVDSPESGGATFRVWLPKRLELH